MQNAETVLGLYLERGRRRLPLEDIYRQLFNRDHYLRAYGNIYRNDGAMTPGTTPETVDALSLEKIDGLLDVLRRDAYRWTPVRRRYIPKKSGTVRPPGIPTWSDKLVQEVVRSLLEAYYEPQCRPHSHGFRPHRGGHTAFGDIPKHGRGVKWCIEGDITHCFDRIDHQVLLAILGENIHDNRFLRLISNLLKAGYLEKWTYNATLSGTPQGGVSSPMLSNISLDRLDQFVEKVLLPAHTHGKRREPYPPYMALRNAARRFADKEEYAPAKRRRQHAQQRPSRTPQDTDFRRLWDVRYADDFLLGCSGPREEAEEIRAKLETFLRETLTLELSKEKTLITQARTEAARFLGDAIVTLDANDKHDHRGQRCINGVLGLQVPVEVIKEKCSRYRQRGKPIHRAERLVDTDCSIITPDHAEYRGFVQYSRLAFNVHRLWRLPWVMEVSLVKTLANKFRTKASQMYQRYRQTIATRHGNLRVLEVRVDRGKTKKPLVARFGGIERRWQKHAGLEDQPKLVDSGLRSEVVQRLLAQQCELCETEEGPFQVHHVRKLADLDRPGQGEKPPWVKRMAARRRKTLVVCQRCHEAIHRERPQRRKHRV